MCETSLDSRGGGLASLLDHLAVYRPAGLTQNIYVQDHDETLCAVTWGDSCRPNGTPGATRNDSFHRGV